RAAQRNADQDTERQRRDHEHGADAHAPTLAANAGSPPPRSAAPAAGDRARRAPALPLLAPRRQGSRTGALTARGSLPAHAPLYEMRLARERRQVVDEADLAVDEILPARLARAGQRLAEGKGRDRPAHALVHDVELGQPARELFLAV